MKKLFNSIWRHQNGVRAGIKHFWYLYTLPPPRHGFIEPIVEPTFDYYLEKWTNLIYKKQLTADAELVRLDKLLTRIVARDLTVVRLAALKEARKVRNLIKLRTFAVRNEAALLARDAAFKEYSVDLEKYKRKALFFKEKEETIRINNEKVILNGLLSAARQELIFVLSRPFVILRDTFLLIYRTTLHYFSFRLPNYFLWFWAQLSSYPSILWEQFVESLLRYVDAWDAKYQYRVVQLPRRIEIYLVDLYERAVSTERPSKMPEVKHIFLREWLGKNYKHNYLSYVRSVLGGMRKKIAKAKRDRRLSSIFLFQWPMLFYWIFFYIPSWSMTEYATLWRERFPAISSFLHFCSDFLNDFRLGVRLWCFFFVTFFSLVDRLFLLVLTPFSLISRFGLMRRLLLLMNRSFVFLLDFLDLYFTFCLTTFCLPQMLIFIRFYLFDWFVFGVCLFGLATYWCCNVSVFSMGRIFCIVFHLILTFV